MKGRSSSESKNQMQRGDDLGPMLRNKHNCGDDRRDFILNQNTHQAQCLNLPPGGSTTIVRDVGKGDAQLRLQ